MAKIKICGITNKKDALAAASFGAWAVGFIFYKKSPRYVDPKVAKKIIKDLPKKIIPVGVFVNETASNIKNIIRDCGLKALQLHGDETPSFCKKFKDLKTIKAFRIRNKNDFKKVLKYKTDYFLFDTYKQGFFGGTGKVFSWDSIKDAKISAKKIILSGGLNPKNIKEAISSVKAYAFDVSSGIEKRPGKKCQRLMKSLFKVVA